MKELVGLTGLRFLAAFYVFVFHMWMRVSLSFLPAPLVNIISQGALGVNVFFVLSGFILTYTHLKDFSEAKIPDKKYYKQFMIKRVARIYPAYLVGLIFFLGISEALDTYPPNFPAILVLDATMLQSYIPSLSMQWYGGGAWSISTEFFFYLLFPFTLPLLLRIQRKQTLLILLVVLVAISIMPGVFQVLWPNTFYFPINYTFPVCRFPEFLCGMILGLLMLRHNFRIHENIALAFLVVTGLYLAKFGSRFPGYTIHNLIAIPTTIAVISVLTRAEKTRFFKWTSSDTMKYLGKISFSFYIMQLPLMFLLDELLTRKVIDQDDTFLVFPVLVGNLLLAIGLFELVEKKAHTFVLGKLLNRRVGLAKTLHKTVS